MASADSTDPTASKPESLAQKIRRADSLPMSTGQGSAGNVIAALCSFFIPGLGQLVQGRILAAILFFVGSAIAWIFLMGWIIHLWSCINAAMWRP
jgi:TM2 domain-containing membrane protein YozV